MSDSEKIKKLETELEHCHAQSTAKSEFLSMVTHQLRTPLSATKWVFKMLLDGDLGSFTEEQREIVKKGYENNEMMIDLLQEVITANKTGEWDFTYKLEKHDLEKILENIVTQFLEEARSKNIHIKFKRPKSPLPLAVIDAEKIAIVFQNLIENAIKYSSEESTVTIHLESSKNTFNISVTDSGIGIPEKQRSRIFEKFFRADNAKEHQKHGTGLGLFTAKKIVERHNGSIEFETETGKGTTFHVVLPLDNPK